MTRPMGLNGPWDSNDFSSAINKNPRLNMPKLRLFEKGALRKKLKKKKKYTSKKWVWIALKSNHIYVCVLNSGTHNYNAHEDKCSNFRKNA